MAPAIKPGDRLLLDTHVGEPNRGDIVSYRATFAGGQHEEMVHRVVGLPGERLEAGPDGRLLVNGAPLVEDYLPTGITTFLREPVDVPASHFFLLGDNRDRSSDSRVTGPIPRADIVSKLTKVDPVKSDEEDPCGVAPVDLADTPLAADDEDPPAVQLLTLPVLAQQAADQKVTGDNLADVRSEVLDYTNRLEYLLAEFGTPDSKATHMVLRYDVIPALQAMTVAQTLDQWTARRPALAEAMTHFLQAIQTEALGD